MTPMRGQISKPAPNLSARNSTAFIHHDLKSEEASFSYIFIAAQWGPWAGICGANHFLNPGGYLIFKRSSNSTISPSERGLIATPNFRSEPCPPASTAARMRIATRFGSDNYSRPTKQDARRRGAPIDGFVPTAFPAHLTIPPRAILHFQQDVVGRMVAFIAMGSLERILGCSPTASPETWRSMVPIEQPSWRIPHTANIRSDLDSTSGILQIITDRCDVKIRWWLARFLTGPRR